MCLWVDIPSPHIVAVVADQHGAADALQLPQGVDKAGVLPLQPHLQVQLNLSGLDGLALESTAADLALQKILGRLGAAAAVAAEDQNVGVHMGLFVDKHQQHRADADASSHGQWYQSRRQDDACGDGPEEECDVQGLLDGGAETNDGQRAYHAQG